MKSTTLQAPHGQTYYYGTGRRKKAIARVFLVPGTGKFEVNGREFLDYFPLKTLKIVVNQPFEATSTEGKFDIIAKVLEANTILALDGELGAGKTIFTKFIAKALGFDETKVNSPTFTIMQIYSQDAEDELDICHFDVYRLNSAKERKKYGLKKARKAGQFSKR